MPRVRHAVNNLRRILRGQRALTQGAIYDDGFLAKLLGKENPVILDIGCNDGSDTLWLLRLFKEGRVFSFEPDPRARKRFLEKVTDPRARLFPVAISRENGEAEFHVSDGSHPDENVGVQCQGGWDLSGSLRKPKEHVEVHPWVVFKEPITVETKRLDSWAEENGIGEIDLIWADVQGAEGDLIAGGKRTLEQTRYIYTEYNDHELYEGQMNLQGLLRLLPGFKLLHDYGNDVLLKNRTLD
jgi:FkbM family methyltransferase